MKAILLICTVLLATLSNAASAQLTWNAISGASGYNVYRSSTCFSNGPYTKLNSTVIPSPSYTDSTISTNTIYCYTATTVVVGTSNGITTSLESEKSQEAVAVGRPKIVTVIVTP
jgi:hypothetical protein